MPTKSDMNTHIHDRNNTIFFFIVKEYISAYSLFGFSALFRQHLMNLMLAHKKSVVLIRFQSGSIGIAGTTLICQIYVNNAHAFA